MEDSLMTSESTPFVGRLPTHNISSPSPPPNTIQTNNESHTATSINLMSDSVEPSTSDATAIEIDDDELIEEALKESQQQPNEEEIGDEESTSDESDVDPFTAAMRRAAKHSTAATPAAAGVPGETYITESGEVRTRRAPRKRKTTEKTEDDIKADEDQRKEAAVRAESLLADLLKRTNEVMLRTMEGSGTLAQATSSVKGRKKKENEGPRRKSEKEEDEELLGDLQEDTLPNGALQLRTQPSIVTGQMRPYQIEGLNWLIRLYHSGVSGILADEMGLGKTLQCISMLAYLRQYQKVNGPHLVLVPLSTLGNWHREFERWCPSIRCFRFHGSKEDRAKMVADGMLKEENWDVLLTSYEMSIREKSSLQKVKWNFIVVDEAHRLKNEGSLLSQIVRLFSSRNRLLLTGTPLQNNLHELWALLNFLLPDIFSSGADFDSMFSASQTDTDVSANLLTQLHKILRPFMLRRLKSQVATDLPPKKETLLFVGMSELQAKLYRGVLERDIEAVLGKCKEKGRLMNIVMQLRKVSNHPYLFEGVEDRTLPPYGDHLIYTSGKMVVLDKLLTRFKAQGSRVLIFSQMTRTLDILEDYCLFRQYHYNRIDGSTGQEDRETSMREFNAENSEKFVFLLSTRAGGLGINLNTADIVILYDSDWNPQMDLQAMDRAHRIGQKKKVFVYRLITENTIEEKIIERAEIKLRLDAMVIQQGRTQPKNSNKAGAGGMSADDVSSMIRFGADRIFRQTGSTVTDADIDAILLAGEQRTQELSAKLGKHVGLLDLSLDGAPPMMLPDENQGDLPMDELERQMLLNLTDSMGKRQRMVKTYDINSTFRDQMKSDTGANAPQKSHLPKPYKIPRMPDYQLWQSKRINELSEKEKAWYEEHAFDSSVPAVRGGLTPAEDAELQRLLAEGFSDWQWADYVAFIAACKRYGGKQSAIDKVVKAMDGRGQSRESIIKYHTNFFEKAPHINGFKSALDKIARGEARAKRFAELEELLDRLLAGYPQRADVMEKLPIYHAPLLKGRGWSLHEDRFLLYWCRILGYGEWSKLRAQIRKDAEFRFDYFIKSRSCAELNRRVDALLRSMKKDESKQESKRARIAQAREKLQPFLDGLPPTTASSTAAASSTSTTTNRQTASPFQSHRDSGLNNSLRTPPHLTPSPSPIMFNQNHQTSSAMDESHTGVNDDVPLIIKRRALKSASVSDDQRPSHPGIISSSSSPLISPEFDFLSELDDLAEDTPLIHRKKYLQAMFQLHTTAAGGPIESIDEQPMKKQKLSQE